ncbi:MAG: glycosyltransferase family 2 protein [bacterium]
MTDVQFKNIAGVVVIYNPDERVLLNIESYISYLRALYIIDNSDNQNNFIIDYFPKEGKVHYIHNFSNIGIASALNIAIKKAVDGNFQFLLTMDHDSVFEENSLNGLIEKISGDHLVGIYSPFHKNKYFTKPPTSREPEEVTDVMTSGNLLNLDAVKKIGLFREDYFIDYVDIEFCLRLRKNGYKILRVNDSFLKHNEGNIEEKLFFGKNIYLFNHNPLRWYYKIRNYFYLKREYMNLFPEYFLTENKNIRNNIIKVIFFEKQKLIKIRMMIKGYLHYKSNIFGKLV